MRDDLKAQSAARIDFFPILSRDANALIVGAVDRHLDCKTSFLLRKDTEQPTRDLIVTAVVQCHNPLGRIYITAIAPFHRLVIRSSLTRAMAKPALHS